MKIGFVIADDNEYKPFLDMALLKGGKEEKRRGRDSVQYYDNDKVIIAVKAGIGKVNAATTAAFLISDDDVDIILNFGLSGAISTHCKGDIVAGISYTECDFDLTALGRTLGQKPQDIYVYEADKALFNAAISLDGITAAKCGCGDVFLADPLKKNLYKETFGITEFDMETGAIASVCHDANIPFLAIRQISDTADDAAANSYRELNNKCTMTLTNVISRLLDII